MNIRALSIQSSLQIKLFQRMITREVISDKHKLRKAEMAHLETIS